MNRDVYVLYFIGLFCCFCYMFFLRDCVKDVFDFYLWFVPGVMMIFIPVFIYKVKYDWMVVK